jgi:hypothetical protein
MKNLPCIAVPLLTQAASQAVVAKVQSKPTLNQTNLTNERL